MAVCEIPCKSYVRQYLEVNYGSPVKLTRRDSIGKYFHKVIEESCDHQSSKYSQYPDKVMVILSEDMILRKGAYITKHGIIDFNNFTADIIYKVVLVYIASKIEEGAMRKKKAYLMAQKHFGFNEQDFPFETIKKAFQRAKKRKKEDE